ncbi:hypothetical protein ACWGST_08010 [Agromyces sp. NPDC055520]
MARERRTIRLAAIGAAVAMGGGLALVGAAPAQAADAETVQFVAAGDIRPDATTYVGWHDGAAAGGTYTDVGPDSGLDVTGKAQILFGFDENADNGDLRELIDDGIYWDAPGAFFQIPLFYGAASAATPDDRPFTTLRPAAASTDGVEPDQQWTTSRAIAGSPYAANATDTLENLLTAIEAADPAADDITLLGYGLFVDAGQTVHLDWVKWGTELIYFGLPPAVEPLGAPRFADSAAVAAYLEGGHNRVVDGGTFTQGTAGEVSVPGDVTMGLVYFDVYAYSAPVAVGVAQADNTGTITVPLSVETLAALEPGEHTLTITPQYWESGAFAFVNFTVVAAPPAAGAGTGAAGTAAGTGLAATGFDATLPLVGGALLLAAGAVLVFRRRGGASA